MKELICFGVGLVVGSLLMKRNQIVDELKKELVRERAFNKAACNSGAE